MGYNGNGRFESGEADWDFVIEDGDLHRACTVAAKRAAFEFELVEFDDAYQGAVLFLAVRPDWQARFRAGTYSREQLTQDIYTNALRPGGVSRSNEAAITASREALGELELGGAA